MSALQRLARWATADPIHCALTIGFGSAFAAYTLEQLQRAIGAAAPAYALLAIGMVGLAAIAQSQRCARLVAWLSTNKLDDRR